MSYLMPARFLAVGRLLAMELQRVPVKVAADALDASDVTVKKMRRGELPNAVTLLRAIENFGLKILEPVLGPMDNASLARRLDLILAEVEDLKHVVSGPGIASSAEAEDRGLVAARRVGGVAPGSGRRLAYAGGESGQAPAEYGGPDPAGLALVETRRLDGIPGADGEALRRHLRALDNVFSLDAARALVKGDNYGRTGLPFKRPGEDWTALVAPENRLWTPSPDPRPITEFAGNVVALRRDLDEAARSTSPVFVSHAGALLRDGDLIPFHSNVVRIPGRAKCGAEMVLTDFVRVRA